MARWVYRYAGLMVASELELPEWRAFAAAASSDRPDVEILLASAPVDAAVGVQPPLVTAKEYRFQVEAIGAYHVQAGRVIRITPAPDAGARELRLFVLGSAWGALCYQRGLLALHASVVAVDGQAVAFCGASGAGKSSVAAWLVAQGYPLVADDLCHFTTGTDRPGVYPAAPRLKLWQEALDHLGWEQSGLERDHFRMEKYHIQQRAPAAIPLDTPLPLRAIYLLGWGETQIMRLTGLAALTRFVEAATYRGDLLEPMGALAAHWQRCAGLARHVPIYRFARPADWTQMPAAMQALVASWQAEAVNAP